MQNVLTTWLDRLRADAVILAFAGVGFLFTLAYGLYLQPEWDPSRDDQQEYFALARGIAGRGEYTRAEGAEAFVPEPLRFPAYPMLIAPFCVRVCSMWGITFTQAVLVAVLVVVVAKLASALIGKRGGIIAGALVALNPSFAFFGAHALSDLLGTLLMVSAVATTALVVPTRTIRGVFGGLLFAAAVLTKPLYVVALPVTLLVVALRHGRRIVAPLALLVIVFAFAVLPYVVHAQSSFGRPLVGSMGTQLWLAYFEVRGSLDPFEREQEAAGRAALARFTSIADRREQAYAWIVLDDELKARALTLIAHDPLGFAARGVLRSAIFWTGDLPLRSEHINPTVASIWRVAGLTLFLVGFLGAILMIRRGDRLTWLPLALILGTWSVQYWLWAEGRYSLPAQPFVTIGVAAMLVRLKSPAPRAVSSRAGTPPPARSQV